MTVRPLDVERFTQVNPKLLFKIESALLTSLWDNYTSCICLCSPHKTVSKQANLGQVSKGGGGGISAWNAIICLFRFKRGNNRINTSLVVFTYDTMVLDSQEINTGNIHNEKNTQHLYDKNT